MQSIPLKLIRRDGAQTLSGANGLSPLLQRVYAARGIHSSDEVNFNLDKLLSYETLPGIEDAVKILEQALRQQQRVLIVGDYDADGTTGTVVLYRALRAFGFEHVDYIVPDRFRFGYGLGVELATVALQEKQPDIIITVDNGISSVEGITAAEEQGVKVIVTDHHIPPNVLPPASAIVNPNLPDSDFPSKALSGVGVAFYVMAALRKHLHRHALLNEPPRLDYLLDLVALGTVADLVPLDCNNRILVEQGLRRIRRGHGNPGIQALFKIAKRKVAQATSSDLAFVIAPRLNAAGRLEDTAAGIACLLDDNEAQATEFASALDEINYRRREMTTKMREDAWEVLEEEQLGKNPDGLCLFSPTWHEGIVGLVAAHLKDCFHRPAIAFAQAQDDSLKGSARSIVGVHIRDLLGRIAAAHPGLITAFGGHATAAGLTLPAANFQQFKDLFEKEIHDCLDKHMLENHLLSDGELGANEISYATARELATAAPWGQGFPEPLFDGVFEVLATRLVGEKHLKLKLQTGKSVVHGIFFNIVSADENTSRQFDLVMNANKIRIAYYLQADEYNGRRSPMLKVRHMEAVSTEGS